MYHTIINVFILTTVDTFQNLLHHALCCPFYSTLGAKLLHVHVHIFGWKIYL